MRLWLPIHVSCTAKDHFPPSLTVTSYPSLRTQSDPTFLTKSALTAYNGRCPLSSGLTWGFQLGHVPRPPVTVLPRLTDLFNYSTRSACTLTLLVSLQGSSRQRSFLPSIVFHLWHSHYIVGLSYSSVSIPSLVSSHCKWCPLYFWLFPQYRIFKKLHSALFSSSRFGFRCV